ncbi:hypothetical protein C1631_010440 [Chryseobacterium phosphatilyticum]|uniref:Secretion system C-terminal sorting domain-containing protein n=1 Tax=Chryseobacterium phosphatilyticum TaxID=475075 RepID=A0A316XDQ5_9FLAO|nr:T9SS type A sorting domain-containing protein [Chryseobacterium phosphatilyticum]PWN70383.1 hypothetical protein C1631_010440 [Chryseobacterium phosphatilyticum]
MKTRNYLLSLVGVLFYTGVSSQTVYVDNAYGGGNGRLEYSLAPSLNVTYQSESLQQTEFAPFLATNIIDFSGRVMDRDNFNGYSNFRLKKYNAEGKLDLSYGNNGLSGAEYNWGQSSNTRTEMLYSNHNDENFIAGLNFPNNLDVYRIGKFSSDGNTLTSVGSSYILPNSTFKVLNIKVLPDNSAYLYVDGQDFRFGIIKLNAGGTLDTSFNGTGRKTYVHNRPGDYTSSVTIDDNNNYYITTSNFNKDERIHDVFIRKFNADGSIDTSFGVNGISKQAPEPNKGFTAKSIAITPDNKILVLMKGYSPIRNILMRLNSDGSLDTSFGQNGYKNLTGLETFNSRTMKIINNKIYLVGDNNKSGTYNYMPMIAKLDINGNLDTSLNNVGIMTQTIYNGYDAKFNDIVLQPTTNKLLVFGESNTPDGKLARVVLRLTDEGFLGIKDNVKKEEELKIYPNPVKDVINFNNHSMIKANEGFIIYDTTGNTILKGKLNHSMKIYVSHLPKGIYMVNIQQKTIKFIKD